MPRHPMADPLPPACAAAQSLELLSAGVCRSQLENYVAMLGAETQLVTAEQLVDAVFAGKPSMPFGTGDQPAERCHVLPADHAEAVFVNSVNAVIGGKAPPAPRVRDPIVTNLANP